MFFFRHPRKVTSDKEVAVLVVASTSQRTPIDTGAPVFVVHEPRVPPQDAGCAAAPEEK